MNSNHHHHPHHSIMPQQQQQQQQQPPLSPTTEPFRPRRRRRRPCASFTTTASHCCGWWQQRHHNKNDPRSGSKKSTTSLLLHHSSSNNNNGHSNNTHHSNGYSSKCPGRSDHHIEVLLLCLFGTILVLISIIAYLVVLLMEPSAITTTSDSEYHWNFGHLLPRQPAASETTKLHLMETPNIMYSKNPINAAPNNNNSSSMVEMSDGANVTTTAVNQTNHKLQIVWLMSFPNSGTSYTSRLVRDVTQTFTASNYADETPEGLLGDRLPVYTNETYGPFWTIPMANVHEYRYPTQYVLTKTHCGIRCSLCSPNEYAETTYSFRRRCLVTKWVEMDAKTQRATNVYSTYPVTHVGRAVHLIRNPFDNVVSRFHLEHHTHPNRTASDYSPDRHGFLRYCLSIDYKYVPQEIKYMHFQENKLLQDLWLVPCHADFMRYVEWHNLAFITTNDLHIPTYRLHYDWYTTRFEQVTTELLQFLQLPSLAAPPPFVPGKVYDDYYTTKEKLIVKRAFEFMASTTTWEHIRQYFPADV